MFQPTILRSLVPVTFVTIMGANREEKHYVAT